MALESPLSPDLVMGRELDDARRRVWLQGVHHLLRDRGGRVVGEVVDPGPGSNYYAVRVELERGRRLRILLNAPAALVGAAEDSADPDSGPLQFRAVPEPDAFTALGLGVAAVECLREPLREEHCAAFTRNERRAVTYHRPTTVGDLLFNWFD